MRSRPRKILAILLVLGTASALLGGGAAHAASCAPADHTGGDWPRYGQSYSNARSQPLETTIGPSNVMFLDDDWTFSAVDAGGTGRFESTPVIAEGCLFVTTSSGYAYALNADSGELVWKDRLATETVSDVCCGGTLFAPTVHDGIAYFNISSNPGTASDERGPYVVAVNMTTWEREWTSPPVAEEPGAYTNTSSIYFDGMIWIGISNPEMGVNQTGGFALIDADDVDGDGVRGEIIKRTRTIPDEQFAAGFGGGSIWSTAAIDTDRKLGYVGVGQPAGWFDKESELVNAIVKFDLDRGSPTFGEIIGAIKGTWDDLPYIDVDFAASPTLYDDADGREMVTAFQKSGWLHAGYTRTMTHAWSRPLAPYGWAVGNYSSQATDGTNIFGVGTYPGQIWSINGTTGTPNWVSPVITTYGANPVAYANGVVYHADGKGFLDAYDAATGVPLLHRPMSADTPAPCANIGGGVAIARNTVYAVCGDRGSLGFGPSDDPTGWVIAYRLE